MPRGAAPVDRGPTTVRVAFARALVTGTIFAVLIAATITMTSPAPSLGFFRVALAIGLSQAVIVGVVPAVLFTSLDARMRRLAAPSRWVFIVGALVVLALTGSGAAGAILVLAGNGDLRGVAARWIPGAAIAFFIALVAGLSALAFDRLRERLHRATSTLRDVEMDRVKAQRLAFEARLASLESRIRPHFLFNSLNAALALIPEDAPAAERVLERLASLLRASLDADPGHLVPLGRELALVVDYLEIERVRFGERLRLTLDIPSDLARTLVPSFSVQTLVENSVKHAIARRPEGGSLGVHARREGDRLVVVVTDDGPGFAPAAMVPGRGLDTLRERLATLFGDDSALTIARPDGGGSAVALAVPIAVAAS